MGSRVVMAAAVAVAGVVVVGTVVVPHRTVSGAGTVADGTTSTVPRDAIGGQGQQGDPYGSGGSVDPYGSQQAPGGQSGDGGLGDGGLGSGGLGSGGSGSGGFGYGGSGSGTGSSGTQQQATTKQQVGIVDIDTVLGYQDAEAAGTGMIVTSNGEVLTNNHVVDGATKITVTVVATGTHYTAKVVGTDPTQDVAVLQLSGASGLATASFAASATVRVGASVTGVGNAGGVGGTPSAATGTVTALNQHITASDDTGANAEKLTGMIETDAGIEPGDSGGPLYDSSDKIVGMDTAASTNGAQTSAGFAIPIGHALTIAAKIEAARVSTSTMHLGDPAFLGVSFASMQDGAAVYEVLPGTPAASAGIAAGDVITAVGRTAVSSPNALEAALAEHRPGQSVTIAWTDSSGQAHHADVTLIAGPAD